MVICPKCGHNFNNLYNPSTEDVRQISCGMEVVVPLDLHELVYHPRLGDMILSYYKCKKCGCMDHTMEHAVYVKKLCKDCLKDG